MLTPDQIRALKPGPELDRAVAHALDYPTHGGDGDRIYQRGPRGTEPLPAYSTTWSGLGLVVEAMERRGWGYGITGYLWRAQADPNHTYMAEFYNQLGDLAAEHASTARLSGPSTTTRRSPGRRETYRRGYREATSHQRPPPARDSGSSARAPALHRQSWQSASRRPSVGR